MDTFISNSAYNVINLYDICALGPKYIQKRRNFFFRAYARTNLIVWPYLWQSPRYATGVESTVCRVNCVELTVCRVDRVSSLLCVEMTGIRTESSSMFI